MTRPQVAKKSKTPRFYQKKRFQWLIGLTTILLLILVALRVSPWPGALVIRVVFNNNGGKSLKAMEAHQPGQPITSILNQRYISENKNALLDVHFPAAAETAKAKLPVVIWTHGGAWLSGNKSDNTPYYKLLAAEGYVVVAPNYSLAPGATYPQPIHELNQAYAYIQENAQRFYADTSQIVLAGDSAGAQLSAQMAALITNAAYAQEVGITPSLAKDQLKGVILYCGIYKMEGLAHPSGSVPKIIGWGTDVTVWAYSGTHNTDDPVIRQMSPYYHATKEFPPVYISGGNGDLLTDVQSKPFATELKSFGVPVEALFYSQDHEPELPHEYQFKLDTPEAQQALQTGISFLNRHMTRD